MPKPQESYQAFLSSKKFKILFFAAFIFYTIVCSLVIYSYQFRGQGIGIFDISYGFGPLVKSIVKEGAYRVCGVQYLQHPGQNLCFSGHRMPFVPFFLAALAFVYNNVLFVSIAKNLILSSLIWICIYSMLRQYKDRKYLVVGAYIFILSFPHFILQNFTLYTEEAYLIPLVSLLFNCLLLSKKIVNKQLFIWLSIANALLFLAKTSMIPLCILFCFFYYIITRNRKILYVFICSLALAFLSWGLFNLHSSGKFTIFSSYSGFTFYAGNNESSLSVYADPDFETLDVLVDKIYCPVELPDEWAYNKYYTDKAIEFITNNPLTALKLFAARFYAFFIQINNRINSPGKLPFAKTIEYAGTSYMLLFRLILWASIFHALAVLFRGGFKNIFCRNEESIIASLYLSFILFYSLPYIVASVYMRHVIPIAIPTIQYAVWAMDKRLKNTGK
ncbi:MAG: hypothetical protein ABH843_07895 [Candidatus Omnitrophota bacterium]